MPARRRRQSIRRNPTPPLPLRSRRHKADSMTELDPVTAQDHAAEPIAAPTLPPAPRKSRAGLFFFGAFSGCLVVFGFVLLFGIFLASVAGNDATTRGDVFGEKVAVIPIDGEILGSRETI